MIAAIFKSKQNSEHRIKENWKGLYVSFTSFENAYTHVHRRIDRM